MSQNDPANRGNKFHSHTRLLFFGHTRNKPKNQQQGQVRQNERKNTSVKKPTSKEFGREDSTVSSKNANLHWYSKILQMWADDDSILRLSWTTFAIIAVSLIAGGVFYAIEKDSKCHWNYWESLWFVNTILTTIGK